MQNQYLKVNWPGLRNFFRALRRLRGSHALFQLVVRSLTSRKILQKSCFFNLIQFFLFLSVSSKLQSPKNPIAKLLSRISSSSCFSVPQALVVCLESKDYTQIRNTIMVLTKVGSQPCQIHRAECLLFSRHLPAAAVYNINS